MRKSAVVIAGIFLLSMFSVLGSVSADVDGVFDIWEKGGAYEYVWWYNHDNSVCKGPEYKAEVAQLLADGYVYRGYAVTESTGGAGPQFGSYDEDYFVQTKLWVDSLYGNQWTFWKSTPTGVEVFDSDENLLGTLPLDGSEQYFDKLINELSIDGTFKHEDWFIIWWNAGTDTQDAVFDGTNTWTIDDYRYVWFFVDGTVHAQIVVKGEEEWDTRTVVYELPQAGAGAPQLMPKNYGNILNKPYNIYGLDEGQAIPAIFEPYIKYDGDKIMTYANSPLDIWFYRFVYTPNHKASQQERLEQTAWYQKAHGAFVAIN